MYLRNALESKSVVVTPDDLVAPTGQVTKPPTLSNVSDAESRTFMRSSIGPMGIVSKPSHSKPPSAKREMVSNSTQPGQRPTLLQD